MATPDDFIEITDFRPGIYGDFHASGNTVAASTQSPTLRGAVPAGNGAATVENTFDCTADQTGALVPLPKATVGRTQQVLPGGNTNAGNSNFMPVGMQASYLLDAKVIPNSYTQAPDAVGGNRVYTFWNHRYSPAGSGSYSTFVQGRQYRDFGPMSFYDFLWQKYTTGWPGQFASASTTATRLWDFV